MRRRALLLTVLALVGVAAVIGGLAATAFGPEDGAPPKPTGKETRIRIQPQENSVACSGDKQAVDIFLDDLEVRPSATNPGANEGLAAFQLTLQYDPSVLRVEDARDVVLNPVLADVQTAGGMRAFIPAPVTIDNLEGYVFLGALGVPQGESFDPAATGIDPVARGEPMLLFTVNFQTVGEGASALSVYTPQEASPKAEAMGEQLLDYQAKEYAPVVNADSSMTVTAGKCAPALPVTPQPTQALPTPFPTATPVVVPTPQLVTPTPAALTGRSDCAEDWAAYDNPEHGLSFCYPAVLRADVVAGPDEPYWSVGVRAPEDRQVPPGDEVLFFIHWRPVSYVGGPGPSFCAASAPAGEVRREEGMLAVLGVDAPSCLSEVHTVSPGGGVTDVVDYFQILTEVPWPPGGFVEIRIAYRGPDFEASRTTAMRILDSILVK